MRARAKWVAGIGATSALILAFGGVEAQQWAPPALVAANVRSQGAPTLSVMTYNVEGLPFPLRLGRGDAARHIADRLREMRAAHVQPHVVVLQEAFGDAQQSIGREAGYRYMAFGPDRQLSNGEPMSSEDRAFADGARLLKGERSGKLLGSGLAILSDYPIVAVTRTAFPAFACAGFDCLANKGVMMASVQVPGVAQPVAVVATHLNSKNASGVSRDRWTYAWLRQVHTMGLFLRTHLDAGAPYVLAGDLNIGRSPARAAFFEAMLAGLPRTSEEGVVRTALKTCLAGTDDGCTVNTPVEVRRSFAHNKDWQAYAPGAKTGVALLAVDAPFGHDVHGRMLSDHIGYTALYRLATAERVDAPVRAVALR